MDAGRVYVYRKTDAKWEIVQTLAASGAETRDHGHFGVSLAASENTVVVGGGPEWYKRGPGTAVVFTSSEGTWSRQQVLPPPKIEDGLYGWAVAVHGDTVAVSNPASHGKVEVWHREGDIWIHEATVTPDLSGNFGWVPAGFGYSVAVFRDRLLVGAPYDNHVIQRGSATYELLDCGGDLPPEVRRIINVVLVAVG